MLVGTCSCLVVVLGMGILMPEIEGRELLPAGGIAPAWLACDNASFGQGEAIRPGELY